MSEQNKKYKIEKIDFGFNTGKSPKQNSPKLSSKPSLKSILLKLFSFLSQTFKFFVFLVKKFFQLFFRLKWKVSRSIFLGRGVYFKYISNFAGVIAIVFGVFVYLGTSSISSNGVVLSKYSSVASANDSVLDAPTTGTLLESKQSTPIKYTVSSGDSLSLIAQKFSTPDNIISIDSILWANNLSLNSVLRPGMILDIPPVSGISHTVKSGDTLVQIAKTYGKLSANPSPEEITGATQEIVDLNLLDVRAEGDDLIPVLIPGQTIFVPGGHKVVAQAPKPTRATQQPSRTPVVVVPPTGNGPISNQGFIWPVQGGQGLVSQTFSSRHRALDIALNTGPNLVAVADGVITHQGWESGGGGYTVHIQFDNGYGAEYAHMMPGTYKFSGAGARVKRGDVIGRMGRSGTATGIHVHFILCPPGVKVNPSSAGCIDPLSKISR